MSPATPTRSSSKSKISELIGTGIDFIPSEVPTPRAIICKAILIQEDNLHNNIARTNHRIADISLELAQLILAQWQKSNVEFKPPVTRSERTIAEKVEKWWNILIKYTNGKASKLETAQIIPLLDKLYDMTFCQCEIYLCNDN